MLGRLPINSHPINGVSVGGEFHAVSASVQASAAVTEAGGIGIRRPAAFTAAAASVISCYPSADYKASAALGVASTIGGAGTQRQKQAGGIATAFIRKVSTRLSAAMELSPSLVAARASVLPTATTINIDYYTAHAIVRCSAGLVAARFRVTRFLLPRKVRAIARVVRLRGSNRKGLSGKMVSAATVSAGAVRNVLLNGFESLSARTRMLHSHYRMVFASGVLQATASVTSAFVAEIHFVSAQLFARATKVKAEMFTWLYAPEPDYRTVFVRNDASTTRMRTFRKQPEEILPYDMDFAEWLAPLFGDDIESAEVHVDSAVNGDPSDLTVDRVVLLIQNPEATQHIAPVRVKVWLSGGNHGATYKVTVRVDTEGGRRKEVDFRLNVREV